MLISLLRSVLAFLVTTYLVLLSFDNFQDAKDNPLSAKTAVFLGFISAANALTSPPNPTKVDSRDAPPILQYLLPYLVNYVFTLFIVFTREPAYAMLPLALGLFNTSTYATTQLFPLASFIYFIAALFYFDDSGPAFQVTDSIRDFMGFSNLRNAADFKGSFFTGKDTVFVNPIAAPVLVFTYSVALLYITSSLRPSTSFDKLFDPDSNGIENISRFVAQLKS